MSISQKALIAISSSSIGVPASIYGTYKYSETTVESELEGKILSATDATASEAWSSLKTKLSGISDENSLSNNIKDLKKSITNSENEGNKIKEWCEENYKKVYKTIFWSEEGIFNDVKKWCSYTFEDKITSEKKLDEASSKTKIESLKTETNTFQDKKLEELKNKSKQDNQKDEAAKELRDYCDTKYKELFIGEEKDKIVKWCGKDN